VVDGYKQAAVLLISLEQGDSGEVSGKQGFVATAEWKRKEA
jgi:predicted RNA-binding protein YlqC (UPF0109 family)